MFIMLCAFLSMTFTACSDDNNEEQSTGSKDFLVGTWKYSFGDDDYDGYVIWTFKNDGTGKVIEYDNGTLETNDTFSYFHDSKNCKITIVYDEDDSHEVANYSKISDTELIIYDFWDSIENWVKQ